MRITTMGVDLAKSVFQVHGVDEHEHVLVRKKLTRRELLKFIANTPACLIGMACGSAHYWGREFEKHGHTVKLIAPQYVKPFVKRNKNDANDAEAICIAARRPEMRFVSRKSIEQQDVQSIHRIRARLVHARTALCNEIRGLLLEYGLILPAGVSGLRKKLPELANDESLTVTMREMVFELYQELIELEGRIVAMDKRIVAIFKNNELSKRIGKIEGVGVITATAR